MSKYLDDQIEALNARLESQLTEAEAALSACRAACEDGDRGVIREAANRAITAATHAEAMYHTLNEIADHFDHEEEP